MEQDRCHGALAPNLCASDYVAVIGSNPTMDRDGHSAFGAMFYAGFPDLYHTIDAVVAEGDSAAVRFTLRGTNTAEFMGMPATGKRIEVTATVIQRIVDGKVSRLWAQFDQIGLMQQPGVIPAPPAA